jgi:hypothetical protein
MPKNALSECVKSLNRSRVKEAAMRKAVAAYRDELRGRRIVLD